MRTSRLCIAAVLFAAAGCASSDDPPAGGSGGSGSGSGAGGEAGAGGASCVGVDFQSDPRHCGGCDHDCLGGACADGACGPVLIFESGPDPINDLSGAVIPDDTAYVSDRGSLYAVPLGSGTVETIGSATGGYIRRRLAVDAERVYWSTTDGLMASNRDGSGSATLAPFDADDEPAGDVALAAGGVFYYKGGVDGSPLELQRVDLATNSVDVVQALAPHFEYLPRRIAATETHVAFSDRGGADDGLLPDGGLRVVDLASGEIVGVETPGSDGLSRMPTDVTTDNESFWVLSQWENVETSLYRVPLDGSAAELVTTVPSVSGVAVDDDFVYVLSIIDAGTPNPRAQVSAYPKPAGAAIPLYEGAVAHAIYSDGRSVFVMEDRRLYRIARPIAAD